ncbi:STAS domain-containing protein [Paenibacillus larvae]
MKELSNMDRTGLGVILPIIKTRHSLQAPLAVEDIPPKIQKLFDITGMIPFLTAVTNTVK